MGMSSVFPVAGSALLAGCIFGDPVVGYVARPTIAGTRAYVQPIGCRGLRAIDLGSGSAETLSFGTSWSWPPSAAGRDVYSTIPGGRGPSVRAYDVEHHVERWHTELPWTAGHMEGMRVVGSGVVVWTRLGNDSTVFTLDRETGAIRWSIPVANVADPDVSSDDLLLQTDAGLEVRDVMTGTVRGILDRSDAVTVADGIAYTVAYKEHLFSADVSRFVHSTSRVAPKRGPFRWPTSIPERVFRVVLVGNDLVVFTSFRLFVVNGESHRLSWQADCRTSGDARDGMIVCLSGDNDLTAWSVSEGRSVWRTRVPIESPFEPVIGASDVMVRNYDHLAAVDRATGQLRYVLDLCAPTASPPYDTKAERSP